MGGGNLGLLQNFHLNSVYLFLYRAEIQSILKDAYCRDSDRYYKLGGHFIMLKLLVENAR